MREFLVRSAFRTITPQGPLLLNRGETVRLSSCKAVDHVASGLFAEKHVGLDLLAKYEARVRTLMEHIGVAKKEAEFEAIKMVMSCLKRHESLKSFSEPSPDFLAEVAEFNRISTGPSPISRINSETGAGEEGWGDFSSNIGKGCSLGCLHCYAKKTAIRFNQIPDEDSWLHEELKVVSTAKCRQYLGWIMMHTSHDISDYYLPAFSCHLYNILIAGNRVLIVTKPNRKAIEAICATFSLFRDAIILRFTIGGLDEAALKTWEPNAPSLQERLWCLKYAFEQGFRTSISSEPMLVNCEEAEKFYYCVEPLVTEDIWFGKMSGVGGFVTYPDPEVARRAVELQRVYADNSIMRFVERMVGLPKVAWKDSIKDVIRKYNKSNKSGE